MNKQQILEQWFSSVGYNDMVNVWVLRYDNKLYDISDYVISNIILNVPKKQIKDEIIERLRPIN